MTGSAFKQTIRPRNQPFGLPGWSGTPEAAQRQLRPPTTTAKSTCACRQVARCGRTKPKCPTLSPRRPTCSRARSARPSAPTINASRINSTAPTAGNAATVTAGSEGGNVSRSAQVLATIPEPVSIVSTSSSQVIIRPSRAPELEASSERLRKRPRVAGVHQTN